MESDKFEERPLELETWLHDADEFTKTFANHDILLWNKNER